MNDQNKQTQHNHPPRCCCHYSAEAITADDVTICPMCTEHGELAQLAKRTPEYPGQPEPQYPCCHQTIGRPHTDYCRAENREHPGQPHAWESES